MPQPKKKKILTHEEVLAILSQQAQDGSVTAAAALERALRARERAEKETADDELDRILGTKWAPSRSSAG